MDDKEYTYADICIDPDKDLRESYQTYTNAHAIDILFNLSLKKADDRDTTSFNDKFWAIAMGAMALEKLSAHLELTDDSKRCLEFAHKQVGTLDCDKWIPVSVLLPPDQNTVLVTFKSEYGERWIGYAWCDVGGRWRMDDSGLPLLCGTRVTAWMAMPKPYDGILEDEEQTTHRWGEEEL